MVTIAQCHTQLFTDEVNLQIDLQNVHFMKNRIVFFIYKYALLLTKYTFSTVSLPLSLWFSVLILN